MSRCEIERAINNVALGYRWRTGAARSLRLPGSLKLQLSPLAYLERSAGLTNCVTSTDFDERTW